MPTPNERLRRERQLRGWSQGHLAQQIDVPDYYISRWERGEVLPSPYYQQKLCNVFGKTAEELGMLQKALPPNKMPENEVTGLQEAPQATETFPSSPSFLASTSSPGEQTSASEMSPRLQLPLTPLPIDEPTSSPILTEAFPSSSIPRSKWLQPMNRLVVASFVLLFLLASLTVGAYYAFWRPTTSSAVTGNIIFLDSGQLNAQNSQGVDDEIQVDLHNISDPASSTSYYAWIKDASIENEGIWTLLGTLLVHQGNAQLPSPYQDPQHADLLINTSSFLVTEEASTITPIQPSTDRSTWRFYSDPPPVTLAHLRHLLANSPELDLRQLYGGVGIWFLRNTQEIVTLASNASNSLNSEPPDTSLAHRQLISILGYIDGESSVSMDVPPNTPLPINQHDAQIALVGPPPHVEPAGSPYNKPGEIVPGYVYLIRVHLDAAVSVPQATSNQRQLATQIGNAINQVTNYLQRVRQDARQLVALNDKQLVTPQAQSTLNDMLAEAQSSYAGPINPDQLPGGANWIYSGLQHMASLSFEVQSYPAQ